MRLFAFRRLKEFLLVCCGADLYQGPGADDVFLDGGFDPPHGVSGEPKPSFWLETFDRLHQPDIAFRYHLGNRQAVAPIPHGDLDHQAQMAGHEFVGCVAVAVFAPAFRQHEFLLRFQQGEPPDLREIPGETRFCAEERQCRGLGFVHRNTSRSVP